MTARRSLEWSAGAAGPVLAAEQDWRAYAACRDTDPDLFFPPAEGDHQAQDAKAKKVCAGCFVRGDCLAFTLTHPDETRYGIWAGMTERQRLPSSPAAPVTVSEKLCHTCSTTKQAGEFHLCSRGTGGLSSSCRECRKTTASRKRVAA